MPNVQEQPITKHDLKAPEGTYRIVREDMEDGELSIVADFRSDYLTLAFECLWEFRRRNPDDVWRLYNQNGPLDE